MYYKKRIHNKSRKGCINCKKRRVKCDEKKPKCTSCEVRQAECEYADFQIFAGPPSRSQSSNSSKSQKKTPSGNLSDSSGASTGPYDFSCLTSSPEINSLMPKGKYMLDMRLMHHYTTETLPSFANVFQLHPEMLEKMKIYIPRLAFHHDFLLDGVLCMALTHLCSVDDYSKRVLPVIAYRAKALTTFRQALNTMTNDSFQAVLMASRILTCISFSGDRLTNHTGLWMTNWLNMGMGPRALVASNPQIAASEMPPDDIMNYNETPVAMPADLESVLRIPEGDPDYPHRTDIFEAALCIGKLFGALTLPELSPADFQARAMKWPSDLVQLGFINLLRQGRQRALVILAYYLVFLAYSPDAWLFEEVAQHDMEKIGAMLERKWLRFLTVPRMAVDIPDEAARKQFLVCQIASYHTSIQTYNLVDVR